MIKTHILHVGMLHDHEDHNGNCGKGTDDDGYMGTKLHDFMWSSCSKKAFMEHYRKLKSSDRWCLPPGKYLTKALSNMLFCFKNT